MNSMTKFTDEILKRNFQAVNEMSKTLNNRMNDTVSTVKNMENRVAMLEKGFHQVQTSQKMQMVQQDKKIQELTNELVSLREALRNYVNGHNDRLGD